MLTDSVSAYGLNLYSLCLTNPVDLAYNEYTIESGIDLTYDPPELSAWNLFWRRPLAKVLAVALFAIAAVIAFFTGNVPIFIKMTLGVLGSLLIGATVAGLQARENGDPFWQSFGNYLNDNWSQTLAVSMAVFIVICGVSLAYHAFSSLKGKSITNTAELDNAAYAQTTYRENFSSYGKSYYSEIVGEEINSIDDLSAAIKKGKIPISKISVNYIVRDGNTLILNTRTGQALTRANIPRALWTGRNVTGIAQFENMLSMQLLRNNLSPSGCLFPISIG